MESINWQKKTVKELECFLIARGVSVGGQKKASLIELCKSAHQLGIEIDPDGMTEDIQGVVKDKLRIDDNTFLLNPVLLTNYSNDVAVVPRLNIFDIYNYLIAFADYDEATFRDYNKMEAYTMQKDGYVIDIKFEKYEMHQDFVALRSQVKPRTREKDPITKLPYYNVWIILRNSGSQRVFSALCSCKGG